MKKYIFKIFVNSKDYFVFAEADNLELAETLAVQRAWERFQNFLTVKEIKQQIQWGLACKSEKDSFVIE